jgi:hypothetical protein
MMLRSGQRRGGDSKGRGRLGLFSFRKRHSEKAYTSGGDFIKNGADLRRVVPLEPAPDIRSTLSICEERDESCLVEYAEKGVSFEDREQELKVETDSNNTATEVSLEDPHQETTTKNDSNNNKTMKVEPHKARSMVQDNCILDCLVGFLSDLEGMILMGHKEEKDVKSEDDIWRGIASSPTMEPLHHSLNYLFCITGRQGKEEEGDDGDNETSRMVPIPTNYCLVLDCLVDCLTNIEDVTMVLGQDEEGHSNNKMQVVPISTNTSLVPVDNTLPADEILPAVQPMSPPEEEDEVAPMPKNTHPVPVDETLRAVQPMSPPEEEDLVVTNTHLIPEDDTISADEILPAVQPMTSLEEEEDDKEAWIVQAPSSRREIEDENRDDERFIQRVPTLKIHCLIDVEDAVPEVEPTFEEQMAAVKDLVDKLYASRTDLEDGPS